MTGRHAGLILPLFAARSTASWGVGEIRDLESVGTWLEAAGFDRLMLLPIGTMPAGQSSPYSAQSTLAIDPIFVTMGDVPDFVRAGGEDALPADSRADLDRARASATVDYESVRRVKERALGLAFDQFVAEEWEQLTTRASALAAYMARERWWLDDYALFRAIGRNYQTASWLDWDEPLRDREMRALEQARRDLKREVLQQQYGQWVAETQWQRMRGRLKALGVALVGDLPFVAAADSVDVWSRPGEFSLDVSAGCPPDAFSPVGQDWGLPTYRWDVIAAGDYSWIRLRARRMAALFDGLRLDHVVGLYRTYGIPRTGVPFFTPSEEPAQRAQGAAVVSILIESGIEVIAEDLGTIPDFVRASLAELGVPGCKVLRWERDWDDVRAPFVPPEDYPRISAAMSGTHDTETLAAWWDASSEKDRGALLALPFFREHGPTDVAEPWSDRLRDALLEMLYRAGSEHLFLLLQDVFGWRERINTPGTVGPANWTWVSPIPVDRLVEIPETQARARWLKARARAHGRGALMDVQIE